MTGIIPPVCFGCGSGISDIWNKYQELRLKYTDDIKEAPKFKVVKPDKSMLTVDTPEIKALRELGLQSPDRICCARMLLSHIDICDDIN